MRHFNAEKYGFNVTTSSLEHENPYYEVKKYEVKNPKGRYENYWIIEQRPFPLIIPLFNDATTLLVGQYRVQADFYSWEFPMGAAYDDDVLSSAKSELIEETGYTANNWKQIGSFFIGPGRTNMQAVVYTAEDLIQGIAKPDPNEFIEIKRIKLTEVSNMIKSDIIKDGPTIAALRLLENTL